MERLIIGDLKGVLPICWQIRARLSFRTAYWSCCCCSFSSLVPSSAESRARTARTAAVAWVWERVG